MAEKTGKSGHTETEQAVAGRSSDDGKRSPIDQQSLIQLLDAHAKAVAVAVGEVLIEKLAGAQSRSAEGGQTGHAHARPRGGEEEIERGHERSDEAWLVKFPPDDHECLRKTDRELRDLEKTLEGPERLLDREQGYNRPPVRTEGTWQLPEYKPVPPDECEARLAGA